MSLIGEFRAYREQRIRVKAALAWAEATLKEGESLIVSITGFAREYAVHGGRLSALRSSAERIPSLIVCEPNALTELVQGRRERKGSWSPLFRSPVFEMWEHTGRFSDRLPARHGLSNEDAAALLRMARDVLRRTVAGEAVPPQTSMKEREAFASDIVSADVAVWVDGELRASMITAGKPLVEAVATAAARAARDGRFRPLEEGELARARLELATWSGPEIPLLPLEIARGDVYYTKAYIARNEGKTGWYLPTVFNCVRFASLAHLLDTLARKKGGFSPDGARYFIAETHGWIESEDANTVLRLRGPMPAREALSGSVCLGLPIFLEGATRSADRLVSLQEPDGSIGSVVDPFESPPNRSMQWVRLAFAAYALAAFGRETGRVPYRDAATRLSGYLSRHLRRSSLPEAARLLTEIYLGQAARALSLEKEMNGIADAVSREAPNQPYEPILYLQASAFLHAAGSAYRAEAEALYRTAAERFVSALEEGGPLSFAAYAELIVLAPLFKDAATARRAERWYKESQQADGSFPDTPDSSFAYTRGTGKIFEAMADDPERYQEQLRRCASWLLSMQYGKEDLYFVPDAKKRAMLEGGFRHDGGNPQAWIDADAHFLLGAARLRARCLLG